MSDEKLPVSHTPEHEDFPQQVTLKKRLGRLRFSIRTLLAVITLFAAEFGLREYPYIERCQSHERIRKLIASYGGYTGYEPSGLADSYRLATREPIRKALGFNDNRINEIHLSDCDIPNLQFLNVIAQDDRLTYLGLSHTNIQDTDLLSLPRMESLEILHIGYTGITDEGIQGLQNTPNVTHLNVRDTQITQKGIQAIGTFLPKLDGISIDYNRLSDVDVQAIGSLRNLIYLNCSVSDVHDEGLSTFGNLEQLEQLYLLKNNITGSGLKYLSGLQKLHTLHLAENPLVSDCFGELTDLPSLETLNLEDTRIDDEALQHIGKLESLHKLSLTNTQVTDIGLQHLRGLKNLRSIYIGNTSITKNGIVFLYTTLPSLQYIETKDTSLRAGQFMPEPSWRKKEDDTEIEVAEES